MLPSKKWMCLKKPHNSLNFRQTTLQKLFKMTTFCVGVSLSYSSPVNCVIHDALLEFSQYEFSDCWLLVAEMIQATGDIGTQWILDLCNGIVKEGSMPDDW